MERAAIVRMLRGLCAGYAFEPVAIFNKNGDHPWPLVAKDGEELAAKLQAGGHLLALPKEPAALANIVEVAVVDFLMLNLDPTIKATRGGERCYPDLELELDGELVAVDVKVAQREFRKDGTPTGRTKSRITLYTGNTFFRYPTEKWDGAVRPFGDYKFHVDVIAIYTMDESSISRAKDFELLVAEPWKIASTKRSSWTREYLGAVTSIEKIRNEDGEFSAEAEFYKFWRDFPWRIGTNVHRKLNKVLGKNER